ncbi:unnamed protein product [Penicillium egyptiacum]|uniref:non-specific serine/threonine protein kinase n=1 Tax=Penicillium egyptiacum TaxID=1303716 RepID=A0A9W4KLM5_9EURO|nr:unnamed protein product [Penicillium egyptiacum]
MKNPTLSLLNAFRSPLFFSLVYPASSKARKPMHNHNQIRGLFCTLSSMSQTPRRDTSFRHLYEPIEAIEKLESYSVGGYHPIAIGDQFHDRYRIVHKLGHGTYSTIWLAQDRKFNRYVAVKVCTADSNPLELDVLSDLSSPQQSQGTSLGRAMIPSVLDAFNIHGPNGTHACYVTTPARINHIIAFFN